MKASALIKPLLAALGGFFCVVLCCDSSADPFRFPKRTFPGGIVSLEPLFEYWKMPHPDSATNAPVRPLAAWKLVRGKVTQERMSGWVVDAQVFSPPPTTNRTLRIFLLHAPVTEKAEFENLTAERDQLIANKGAAGRGFYSAQTFANSDGYASAVASGEKARRLRQEASEMQQKANTYSSNEKSIEARLKEIDLALEKYSWTLMPTSPAYPAYYGSAIGKEYIVEWFALDTGTFQFGLPVFDCGFYLSH